MARTINQPGTNLEDSDSAKTGARPNHLSGPVDGWLPLCTHVSFGHSRTEERHEQESNNPAPSGSLLVAFWTSLPHRQHNVPVVIVGLGRSRPQDHLPDRLRGTQR